YDGAWARTWEISPMVRHALAQEPIPEEVVLAHHDLPNVRRNRTWTTSFTNDGSHDNLTFTLAGPNGDGDLYVRYGAPPTTSTYDCRPYLDGTNETCAFDPAEQGTYYVMVHAYRAISGATLTVSTFLDNACDDADS